MGEIMMPKHVALSIAAAAVFAFPAAAQMNNTMKMNTAPGYRVDCPLPQIRREVTTPLPEGWWNTPYIGPLQRTFIQNVGGEPTLMCDYGNAGIIMHRAPPGAACRPAGNGFECR